mmetsp:Transcript_17813/g.29774  ORF Transcript_17813/g.29774 Transcript_17813/m.29774 type:complete len:379 (-) Transcript_17813:219-1355(-)
MEESILLKSTDEPAQLDNMELFCHLMVEEFLMKKGMSGTLDAFREEWKTKPDEMAVGLNWIDVSLKLHLPDVMKAAPNNSVIENVTSQLLGDASTRMRKPKEILLKGLAENPRQSSTSSLYEKTDTTSLESPDFSLIPKQKKKSGKSQGLNVTSARPGEGLSQKYVSSRPRLPPGKVSSENWIPENIRFRSIYRDIAVAKQNLTDTIVLETEMAREMKRFQETDLQKAHNEESLGTKKKSLCACCLQSYSYVNLPMRIPVKAIIDSRKQWSNGKGGWWDKEDERLSVVPRCYEGVDICRFCAQFFNDQEKYRPSFEAIAYEERKTAFFETKRLETEYWDPLKMCEKDREKAEDQMFLDESARFSQTGGTNGLSTVEFE